uniref:B12-binding domain-containing radical SAM protein n=1 Tax=Agathobacter sp. TaxID=2021311 RepID=UPI00405707ED
MKILLAAINAKYIHSNPAVHSLKAYAKEYASHIEIGEFTINNRADDILMEIYKRKPDVLCFSCYIWNIRHVEEMIKEYHKLCPNVPIWLGGPEVSFETTAFLEGHPEVTGIMIGEGEETFFELCRYYLEKFEISSSLMEEKAALDDCFNALCDIRGIAYRQKADETEVCSSDLQKNSLNMDNGEYHNNSAEIVVTLPRPVMDMQKIPFCYNKMEDFSNRIIYYESSRGCPFSCSYCLSSVDKKLRFRNPEQVKEELAFFMEQNVPQVKFVDRTFNCNHTHAMEIWRFIKEKDNGITNFHFEISADLLNEEELALISDMRPGLIQLEIGVQSTNKATIQEIKRTMKLEYLKETVRKIQSFHNIHQHLDLIAGLPYEDYASFQKSFDDVYALQPEQLQLGFLKVLKGSYMYEHAAEYEICYHDSPPYEVLSTKWLSFDEIIRLKRIEEVLEVYYNSRQFEISMRVLGTCFSSAFLMYEKLGDFYEEKGYFGMSHSRIRRCEILIAFAERLRDCGEVSAQVADCIKEALIFDLYYRENCKSRPSWARDAGTWKAITRTYCKNGKLSHTEPFHYDFLNMAQQLPEYTEAENWVLFSYDKRNPFTHQAKVQPVFPEFA